MKMRTNVAKTSEREHGKIRQIAAQLILPELCRAAFEPLRLDVTLDSAGIW
jgi:hypothetical protein